MPTAESASDGDSSPVEQARDELQDAVPKAAATLGDLLDADDERVQIRAAEAVLDRAGLTKGEKYSNTKAQLQIGGGERPSKYGDPLEEPDEDDPAAML
jgi:hypothetical protein